ncbi:MAG: hypothetical protein Q9191_008024 [Dirinaria sp. TL-2023a]
MYLPRALISHLYQHLRRTYHALSPPVLILVALEPDALCACRIFTALLKRDYIQHKIQPMAGYSDLAHVGETLVQPMRTQQGGSGGLVVCLGVGGLVDMSNMLGLDDAEDGQDPSGGVEVWIVDAKRPWNLGNVFGGNPSDHTLQETNGNAKSKNLGVIKGQIQPLYNPGQGGIIVYDDGDVDEELGAEREAYCALAEMPDIEDNGDSDNSGPESDASASVNGNADSRKRKFWGDPAEDERESDEENTRPQRRRRSNSDTSISSSPRQVYHHAQSDISRSQSADHATSSPPSPKQPSARRLRRRLLRLRRKHSAVLENYYTLGTSYSEPISSMLYSLAEDLGREDNDLLWHAIVGVSSLELYGRTMTGVGISSASESGGSAGWGGQRGERIRQILRDEVRRLNPPDRNDSDREVLRGEASGVIPTTAKSPTDTSIRLSPEPRFLLIRHWSLYDSMLHSPYLSARLHIWSDVGRKRLHKLLAKMGVSLSQCKQSYTHMDMDLKKGLRQRLLMYAPMYGLDGLVPPAASGRGGREGWGFVRSWGWKATLSAVDVGVIAGAILEIGKAGPSAIDDARNRGERPELVDEDGSLEGAEWVSRFWEAYDALGDVEVLKHALPMAQHLHRAILRTGTSLLEKKQIRHLRAFRMAVVKEGPDVQLFTHPSALTKLALWVGEAIAEQEKEQKGKIGKGGKGTPLVLAGLNEGRGVYVVVGTGGGGGIMDWKARQERKERAAAKRKQKEERKKEKARRKQERAAERAANGEDEDEDEEEDATESEDSEDSSDDDLDERMEERGFGKNRFGNAFQEVVDETNARVRIDSFEHCVVEVKKEDLSGFLESLSMKAVVG